MGRYAFFNTEFEYKFRFGVQSSSDMRSFGGRICHELYEGGEYHHEWEKKDTGYILEQLNSMLEWIGEEPVKFELYEKNVQGTYNLKQDLYDLYAKGHNEELVARYILGCCLYHQLLYTELLEVAYEGWN
jgi:hypothetical protein